MSTRTIRACGSYFCQTCPPHSTPTPKEAPVAQQFQPGDKVRVTSAPRFGGLRIGLEGIVERVTDYGSGPFVYLTRESADAAGVEAGGWFPSRFELVLAAWERELLEPAVPVLSVAVGDLVRSEKGGEIHEGRARAGRVNGSFAEDFPGASLYIGTQTSAPLGSLVRNGATVTVIEKAPVVEPEAPPAPEPKPLPTEVGFYVAADDESVYTATVYRFDTDGDWSLGDDSDESPSFEEAKAQAQRAHDRVGLVRLVPETAKPAERFTLLQSRNGFGIADTEQPTKWAPFGTYRPTADRVLVELSAGTRLAGTLLWSQRPDDAKEVTE